MKDVVYDSFGNKLDVYLPHSKDFVTVVYFHGGGLCSGDKADPQYVDIAQYFADNGYAFVSVNYRMYPNAHFPDYLVDAGSAVKFVCDNCTSWGGNGKVIVSGQSAGAWMALMLCLNKEYLANAEIDTSKIVAWISDSAQTTSHFNVLEQECKLHPLSQRIDQFAPLYFVNENTTFAPLLLIYYSDDMPNRLLQNKLFAEVCRNFNSKLPITEILLQGGHCSGSSQKDENGQYSFAIRSIQWLKTVL